MSIISAQFSFAYGLEFFSRILSVILDRIISGVWGGLTNFNVVNSIPNNVSLKLNNKSGSRPSIPLFKFLIIFELILSSLECIYTSNLSPQKFSFPLVLFRLLTYRLNEFSSFSLMIFNPNIKSIRNNSYCFFNNSLFPLILFRKSLSILLFSVLIPNLSKSFIKFSFIIMGGNGWRYETLGISELQHYQGTTNFDARTEARITTSPPMFYDRVLGLVIFSSFVIISSENFNNSTLLFSDIFNES